MARQQISTIFQNIGATVNQDPSVVQDGSADWLLWMQFLNRAQVEWAESNDWEQLKKRYYPTLSIPAGASLISIGLPLDFRFMAGPVINYNVGFDGGLAWPEILPERKLEYSTDDHWFLIEGDPSNGYHLTWSNGSYALASLATIEISYYSMPTSITSASQYPVIPDSEYLTQRVIAYVLEARSDPRYQDEEQKARERLLTMIDNANAAKYNPYTNPIRIHTPESRQGLRIGKF